LRQDLVAIDVDEDLRNRQQKRACCGSNLRPLAHGFEEAGQIIAEEGHVAARAVFEHFRAHPDAHELPTAQNEARCSSRNVR